MRVISWGNVVVQCDLVKMATVSAQACVFFPVAYKERPPSPTKNEKLPQAGQKGKPKGKVEKGGKEKQDNKGSRPPSQQFDITKPNWTLRIVVDAATAVSGPRRGSLWLLLSYSALV